MKKRIMSFPIPGQVNVCVLVGNDACGIVSALRDVVNVAILENEKVTTLLTITSESIRQNEKLKTLKNCMQKVSNDPVKEIANFLSDKNIDNLFLLLSGDACVMLPLDHGLKQILCHSRLKTAIVLADMCRSGCFLGFPKVTIQDGENLESKTKTKEIYCITACDSSEYDQDDISEMGFDGGLTADLVDFLIENQENFNVFKFYEFRSLRNLNKQPQIHSILSQF